MGKRGLGQLIDMISNIQVRDQDACSKDVIRRAYKYCLWQTSSAEKEFSAESRTPRQAVDLLVKLEALHWQRTPDLGAAMPHGHTPHIDATCDQGWGGTLLCLASWVLHAVRIASENAGELRPAAECTARTKILKLISGKQRIRCQQIRCQQVR